ncbi:protein NRT1/ PTR FAMILY 5.10-like [Wolffia australiana]
MGGETESTVEIRSDGLPVDDVVDYRGRPVFSRSTYGGWSSALFIIGVEVAERCAYYGISSNLITYLTGPLRQSVASAAANVNAWSGVSMMLPLLGGALADSVGRYRTIVIASILYVLSLAMLTLSAVSPALRPRECPSNGDLGGCLPPQFQSGFFFFSLYMAAIAMAGHKPCVQAFGADQFDENDPEELKSRSSFFNWWYFGMNGGMIFTYLFVNYVQDEIGWGLGFGLPCVFMALAMVVFLLGTRTYRYVLPSAKPGFSSNQWKKNSPHADENQPLILGSKEEDESVSGILRLFPIWASCLMYAVVFAQSSTFFTKQGSTMDRRIGPSFRVPPAALQSFISISVVVFIPIYDRVLVPAARTFTGRPSGITMLQRIGIGVVLSIASMVVAAFVEMKRLRYARELGPIETVPMSLWWLVPQYVLFGASDVFTMVGLQEFFYDQVPDGLRSLGLGLYLSIFGVGSFVSSFLVSAIDGLSRRDGDSWFADDLNRGHLDYFYWLIAGLSSVALVFFVYFSRDFHYKVKGAL